MCFLFVFTITEIVSNYLVLITVIVIDIRFHITCVTAFNNRK